MFSFTSIKDYHASVLHGQATSVEAVQYYLGQIATNQYLNAYLEVFDEEALSRAHFLDNHLAQTGKLAGALHGVVIGLKDVICYKGHRLTAASRILEGFTSIYNATAVERLLAAGAIIIGRQNCDEFAMGSSNENSAYGKVLNAADNSRVPGGSSGGSAVAVQANLCMVSLGSDTGGSVRQPADFCGIVGMKPTYGRISRYGLIAYASSFDQIGILAKSVADTALVLETIAGQDQYDSTALDLPVESYAQQLQEQPSPKRIAYFKQVLEHEALDPEIAAAFKSFVKTLTENGYDVQAVDFEYLDYVVPAYYVLTTAEASSNLSRYDGVKFGHRSAGRHESLVQMYNQTRTEAFGKEVQRRILLGTFVLSAGYFDAYFTKAQKVRALLMQKTNDVFAQFDAVISPTVPSPAFKFGEITDPIEMFLADIYTVFANLTGIPAISLPLFIHSNNMPFGLQVMTSRENDLCLLTLSEQIMLLAGKK